MHFLLNKFGLTCKSHCMIFFLNETKYFSNAQNTAQSAKGEEGETVPEN